MDKIKKMLISGDLVNLKCRQAGWSCRDRKDWKTCEKEKRLQETMTKFIKFCFTPGHSYEGILDTLQCYLNRSNPERKGPF